VAPALVSPEEWDEANVRLDRNRREFIRPDDRSEDALLRVGFIYCRHCGHRMTVYRRRGKTVYRCTSNTGDQRSGCKCWQVRAEPLNRFAWQHVES
jgi:hypothetical protein